MEEVRQYILSVIAAAFVCAILTGMLDRKGSMGTLLRLMGGLFLTFTILSPVVRLDFSGITDYLEDFTLEGEYAAASGGEKAEEEFRAIINEQVEAYILDKAQALGASLTVEVTFRDDEMPVPESATLRGTVAPYAKTELQQILEKDLGIAKENQRWIGRP